MLILTRGYGESRDTGLIVTAGFDLSMVGVHPSLPRNRMAYIDNDVPRSHLEEHLDRILGKYGHYVLYIRTDPKFTCRTCWDHATMSPSDASCPECLGTGHKLVYEKHLMRKSAPYSRGIAGDEKAPFGIIDTGLGQFVCKYQVFPQVGDLICEAEWDVDRAYVLTAGVPIRVSDLYRITNTTLLRWEEGRALLFWCQTENVNMEMQKLEQSIIQNAGSSNRDTDSVNLSFTANSRVPAGKII